MFKIYDLSDRLDYLYFTNQSRLELKMLCEKYKYNSIYILVKTTYELAYHLNLYRSLFEDKQKVPEIVYMKYRKDFEYPDESDWNEIIEYKLILYFLIPWSYI